MRRIGEKKGRRRGEEGEKKGRRRGEEVWNYKAGS
jgi:hypothetical protein